MVDRLSGWALIHDNTNSPIIYAMKGEFRVSSDYKSALRYFTDWWTVIF